MAGKSDVEIFDIKTDKNAIYFCRVYFEQQAQKLKIFRRKFPNSFLSNEYRCGL